VAYDIHPPGKESGMNAFFDGAYMDNIHEQSCTDVFSTKDTSTTTGSVGSAGRAAATTKDHERTLLLIWPNDPDPEDNPYFCDGGGCQGSQAVWDADCLLAFINAGGEKVIYVGERETRIQNNIGTVPDCGISSTRQFQLLLQTHFHLVTEIPLPNWWLNEDDLTVWERRHPVDAIND
jgi:hypothetical protein